MITRFDAYGAMKMQPDPSIELTRCGLRPPWTAHVNR
jgi:hypothetical protein